MNFRFLKYQKKIEKNKKIMSTTDVNQKELKTVTELKRILVLNSFLGLLHQYYTSLKNKHYVVKLSCTFAEKSMELTLAVLSPLFFFYFQKQGLILFI